ncbi:MAG: tryptophan synthase subunit alpha [Anaerolineae bacterium]|nr:tryptophan synthase subunit alpha [Anaerolineae bacterium]
MTTVPREATGTAAVAAMFERARSEERAAFLPFVMLGYPTLAESIETVSRIAALGVDGFEIGVPFSDPVADGPTIQHASQVALENSVTVETGLQAIRELRARGVGQPMLLFSYLNPLLAYGHKFAQDLAEAGADGLICPDLPPEEAALLTGMREHHLAQPFFLAPTSSDGRIAAVAEAARGFIYVVSVTGITGARSDLPPELSDYIGRIRARTSTPLVLGFGISTPEQVRTLHGLLDGYIVASALIRKASEGLDSVIGLAQALNDVRP